MTERERAIKRQNAEDREWWQEQLREEEQQKRKEEEEEASLGWSSKEAGKAEVGCTRLSIWRF